MSDIYDPSIINELRKCAEGVHKLTRCLASVGEDALAIIPRIQLPLNPQDSLCYSTDLAEMQTQIDPYPAGSPSLPTYLTGELERIRYQLAQIMGNSYWYEDPAESIASLSTTLASVKSMVEAHKARHLPGGADELVGVAYSQLTLTDSLVNADINAAAAIAYSKLNLAASLVNADINAAAAIAYSKLNLALSIVNADIAAGAGIAWSKIAVDPNVTYDDVAATIAALWTFDGGIRMGNNDLIEFYDDTGDHRGRITAFDDEFRLWTKSCYLYIRDIDLNYTRVYIETGAALEGGVYPTTTESGQVGNNMWIWNSVTACTLVDFPCSFNPEPQNAFELLALQKHLLTQDCPPGKFHTRNLPAPLRGRDNDGNLTEGRNISRTLDWVVFAMGDIAEKLDALEQRLDTLEAS